MIKSMRKKKKGFSAVKQVKSLSRSLVRSPAVKQIQPQKQKLLAKVTDQEIREVLEES